MLFLRAHTQVQELLRVASEVRHVLEQRAVVDEGDEGDEAGRSLDCLLVITALLVINFFGRSLRPDEFGYKHRLPVKILQEDLSEPGSQDIVMSVLAAPCCARVQEWRLLKASIILLLILSRQIDQRLQEYIDRNISRLFFIVALLLLSNVTLVHVYQQLIVDYVVVLKDERSLYLQDAFEF